MCVELVGERLPYWELFVIGAAVPPQAGQLLFPLIHCCTLYPLSMFCTTSHQPGHFRVNASRKILSSCPRSTR